MQAPFLHILHHQHLWLTGYRSIFWEEASALIISDCHFGKTGHFRKAGIAVPQQIYKEDLQRLVTVLTHFKPKQLIVVGDLFHSHSNLELEWFKNWRNEMAGLRIILVKGNHDILKANWYENAGIELVAERLKLNSFVFSHENCHVNEDEYSFCGHVHPGIMLQGTGKQSLRFPCFYFSKQYCILPAFSKFTGLAIIEPKQGEHVYAVVEDKVLKIH
ncbi:MAG: ligase-associated DNA damage response endonuclease PdeM [Flavisolibacter sp.]|jgi:DNA ligase-associated metallophosphoesterase|nr:ligase-associated DNA damage response endonuclease PdeM [Flavisolibacter sp.]